MGASEERIKARSRGRSQRTRIGVLTSGGDSPGMNAALRAVTRRAIDKSCDVVGFRWGFRGLMDGNVEALTNRSVGGIIDRGGTFLGTARSKEFATEEGRARALATAQRERLDGLVVVGGEGSLAGAHTLHEHGVRVVGIPATIDNDVGGTDVTIGFDTALNTVLEATVKIRDTASAFERIFVIEVMGRTSGHLALNAAIAGGADFVLIPELPGDIHQIADVAISGYRRGKLHTLVVVAEGAASGEEVAAIVRSELPDQDVRVSVLGHIQRGGAPSGFDRMVASRMGAKAVDLLLDGLSDVMVGYTAGNLTSVSLDYACTHKRAVNPELYKLCQILAQ